MRSTKSINSVSDIPCPVFGNLYTRNSVSLNKSMEKVPGKTLVQASQMSLLMPAFQQYSGTLWSCSRITSESLNTLTYRQYDFCLGVLSGKVGHPTGLPACSLGGSAVVVSSIPDRRSEGSRSPTALASTGVTFSIPSFESISALTVVYIRAGFAELQTGMFPNPAVRVMASVA